VPTFKVLDKSKPSSHNWTGIIIRAFAHNPRYRNHPATSKAVKLLKQSFFLKGPNYSSMHDADFWIKFDFPYWWNNLVAALDFISKNGISPNDKDIIKAINWFIDSQQENGLWKISYTKKGVNKDTLKTREISHWITLQICLIFKRLFG